MGTIDSPAAGMAVPGLWNGAAVEIMDDGNGIAEALAKRLRLMGARAVVAQAATEAADAVILLSALGPLRTAEEALAVNRRAFAAAKTVAGPFSRRGGTFVTVQDTGGSFGFSGGISELAVWTSGLPGLAKTAAKEWPLASVKAIDIDRRGLDAEETAERIFRELLSGGPEPEVGLTADGGRVTIALKEAPLPRAVRGLEASDPGGREVLVVSGGARGVTAAAVAELARVRKPVLLLLGRTALEPEPEACRGIEDDAELKRVLVELAKAEGTVMTPIELMKQAQRIRMNREIAGNLELLRASGSEAVYVQADVQDEEALRAALVRMRARYGRITGIVHGAGVLADKRIMDKSLEQFDAVFDTKTRGLRSLLAATAEDPLTLICLFASVAARSGNHGQADYAMANEVLNKAAHYEARRRGPACKVVSINWGPWDGGMVSPQLKRYFEERRIGLLPLPEGSAAFVREVASPNGPIEVVIGGGDAERSALIEGVSEREWQAALLLREDLWPALNDHCIDGRSVVPAVLVMDWFLRAASAAHPGLRILQCRNLKVKKGIVVLHGAGEGDWLAIRCMDRGDGLTEANLRFSLCGPGGRVHYTAEVEMGKKPLFAERAVPAAMPEEPWDWKAREIYDGRKLFHGPRFQVVRELTRIGDSGGAAVLGHGEATAWSAGGISDPAMLDGGLQLARLWGIHSFGEASLPTEIGRYVPFGAMPAEESVICRLSIERAGRYKTISQLEWLTREGRKIAELRDVEMHIIAEKGRPSDFQPNSLQEPASERKEGDHEV